MTTISSDISVDGVDVTLPPLATPTTTCQGCVLQVQASNVTVSGPTTTSQPNQTAAADTVYAVFSGFQLGQSALYIVNSSTVCSVLFGPSIIPFPSVGFSVPLSSLSSSLNLSDLAISYVTGQGDLQTNQYCSGTTSVQFQFDQATSTSAPPSGVAQNPTPINTNAISNTSSDLNQSASLSTGAKAGIGVGVLIGLVLFAIFLTMLIRRSRRHRALSSQGGGAVEEVGVFGKPELAGFGKYRAELSSLRKSRAEMDAVDAAGELHEGSRHELDAGHGGTELAARLAPNTPA